MNKSTFVLVCNLFLLAWGLYTAQAHAGDDVALSVVTQNLNRFFDDKDDGNREKIVSTQVYEKRLRKLAKKIKREYDFADVMAFQEVENIDILQQLSEQLSNDYDQHYQAVLIEGNDSSGIDVGYLVKRDLTINSHSALFNNKRYGRFDEKLFSRPPLMLEVCVTDCVTMVNLHLKSMRGLRSPKKGQRVLNKRHQQAETLARWINQFQQQHPQKHLMLLGDFNALNPSDSYADLLGTILGQPDQQRPRLTSPDLIAQDLIDASLRIPPGQRFSYRYKKRKQQLDYLLISQSLQDNLTRIRFSRIDYKLSDHAALIAHFRFD